MKTAQHPLLFLNLAVSDLGRSMKFFSTLGFEFNPKFSDEKAACMIINDKASVMLLTRDFFKSFTSREICDTKTHTEGLVALSCESREAVNTIVEKALAAGGSKAQDPVDHGFMYGWSFYDPDGHHFEVLWMDPKVAEG